MSNWNYPTDLLEAAWGLIANAFEGNWDKAPKEWQDAAVEWRDAYFKLPKEDSAPPKVSNVGGDK